jgi:NTE family protein
LKKVDAVFEGGGVKGIALVGAIDVTEGEGYHFENVAGTSAGAIVASLVASNYSARELKDVMEGIDYLRLRDSDVIDDIPVIGKAISLLFEKGIYEGRFLEDWLRGLLQKKGVRRFGDLIMDKYRDEEKYKYRLRVVASDISRRKMIVLPQDIKEYEGMSPDSLEVAMAVRMSMSIPFFFEPVKLRSKETGEDCYIVDGGILSNFPVWLFDDGTEEPPWPTFGYMLCEGEGLADEKAPHKIKGVISMLRAILSTMLEAHDKKYLRDADFVRTILIPTMGVCTTEFDLSREKVNALYESGRKSAEEFFMKWDFDLYKEEFRKKRMIGRRERLIRSMKAKIS